MKVAVAYRLPIGPMQASLALAAKAKGFDVLEMPKGREGICPEGKNWDDYDVVVYFHTHSPTFQTSAKVLWWMCDLRDPKSIAARDTVASEMFLCNQLYKDAYSEHFGVPAYYMPQCGIDFPMEAGRTVDWDALFLGVVPSGHTFEESNPATSSAMRSLVTSRLFHGNRHPVISEVNSACSVKVISREGLTEDQRWLYYTSPVSLSISLPAEGYTSNRLYNIISSGGFALVNWFPGIEYLFDNGSHLVWFKTPEEARELAVFYLKNPKERDKIALAGQELYKSRDTAAHRLDYMLGYMKKDTFEVCRLTKQ